MLKKLETYLHRLQAIFFSDDVKRNVEVTIIGVAITAFLVHLVFVELIAFGWIQIPGAASHLFNSPIATIYTPFSFVLFYEVYLLLFYLPRSYSLYIVKQYEIMTLIVIRRAMKDISHFEINGQWFQSEAGLQFTYDILAAILLFFLIFLFYRLNQKKPPSSRTAQQVRSMKRFVLFKGFLSLFLLPVFVLLGIVSLSNWIHETFFSITQIVEAILDINKIFFEDFFTILILVDVLILLFSFLNTDKFYKVMRNSGFVISTILIKLSFATGGLVSTALVVGAVLFGIAILAVHNQFEKLETI
jgi:hypothetical protein